MIRYLSGLLVCGLGLFGGGWLIMVAVLLRGTPTIASLASAGTGAGVALVSAIGVACWAVAWRQRMRRDGVLARRPRPVAEGRPAATVRRNRRALRRDVRPAARAACRTPRRDEAPEPDGAARGDGGPGRYGVPGGDGRACPDEVVRRDELARRRAAASGSRAPGRDRRPAIPGPRIPVAAEASRAGPAGAAEPERPAVVLTELRALLEPLLTTGPGPAGDGEPGDGPALDFLGEEEAW
jgi:hypothetical protein